MPKACLRDPVSKTIQRKQRSRDMAHRLRELVRQPQRPEFSNKPGVSRTPETLGLREQRQEDYSVPVPKEPVENDRRGHPLLVPAHKCAHTHIK